MVGCLQFSPSTSMRWDMLQGGRQLTVFLVSATQAIANVVKSSFGPSGLDKMMVDDIGVRI